MRAHRIIEGSAFGPEAMNAASEAFDAAWAEIADRFDPSEHDAARDRLAMAIVSAVREDSRQSAVLRKVGLQAIAREYPDLFTDASRGEVAGDRKG